jgi:K+-sensing histidine kinase KdpD
LNIPRAFCGGDATSSHSSGFFAKFSLLSLSLFSGRRSSFDVFCRVRYNTKMQRFLAGRIFGLATAGVLLAGITLAYTHALHVNQTTVALSLLLAILAVSAVWGMAVSVLMSIAGVLAFNFYFLPPTHTFTISDPQNWVALGA